MEQSIVFSPEVDERELSREKDAVNDELQDVAGDIPVEFQGDMSGIQDGLEMPGGGGGAGGGGSGGGGGAADGAAAMAGKIPKPVAGVAAAAALPVALAGGIGLGMLEAMKDSSAKLGTSASILGVAKDNFFRAPGDLLDKTIVRPLSEDLLDVSTTFDELFRSGKESQAMEFLTTGNVPSKTGLKERAGGILGTLAGVGAGAFAGAKVGGAAGAAAGSIVPGVGTAAVGTGGAITGAIVGAIGAAPIGGRVGAALADAIPDFNWPTLPEWPGWPNVDGLWPGWPNITGEWPGWPNVDGLWPGWPNITGEWPGWPNVDGLWPGWPNITGEWPGWPNVDGLWPGWPNITGEWPGWPNVDGLWPGWPNITGEWPGWPNVDGLWPGWPSLNVSEVLNTTFNVGVTANDIVNSIRWPDVGINDLPFTGGGGGGGGIVDGIRNRLGSGNARGGVVNTSGVAQVHSGEMIGDERQLIEELSNAIDGGGGGDGSMDTSALETKLDRLHRDLKQLHSAFDVTLETDEETLARSSNNGRRNRLGDTDPTL